MDPGLKSGGDSVSGSASTALPGQKLATSRKPRMLTPSEIELLRQDLRAALKVLGQDEIDDAHALIREIGLRPADFEILQRADPSASHPGAITGRVTVLRKSSGASMTYQAGTGSHWLEQLETDLKLGAFGK